MYSNKVANDKFYTKIEIAKDCISKLDLSIYDLIIEPAAGNGSFYNNIENCVGLDIIPEHQGIKKQDWFTYQIHKEYKNVLVIGNPPFGKRNKLSREFIKHACSFDNVQTVAFILPDVYNKSTLQSCIPEEYRIKEIHKLSYNSFLIEEKEYHVPCSFFIFDKSDGRDLRFDIDKYKKTEDWCFDKKYYDFFVMGANPKIIKKCPEKNNRGYYISVNNKNNIEKVKTNFRNITWKGYSSATGGVVWFTSAEIIKHYNEYTEEQDEFTN